MVKILRYNKQTGVTPKAPNTYSQTRFNPSDFSRASDAIGQLGKQAASTGLDLFSQQESNKSKKAEQLSNQDMKMLETLEKQKTTMDVFQLKMDRANTLHEKMDFALNGTAEEPGLTTYANDYTHDQDYKNNERNFADVAEGMKQSISATIEDDVVRQDFEMKFDNKAAALKLNVMNGSFKTGLAQRTSAYKAKHKQLLYDMEYGNHLEQKNAKDELLGLNGVISIHEEAFDGGIINTTPELAIQYSQGEVEFIKAKLMIADDPQAYMDLAKGKTHDYPFKNLTVIQRSDLDIKAQKQIDILESQAAAATKKMIAANQKTVSDINAYLDDGILPENGLTELGIARSIAEDLGDTDTVKEIDNHFAMWSTYQAAQQSNPLDLQAKIDELQIIINKSNTTDLPMAAPGQKSAAGVKEINLLKMKALQNTKTKMDAALAKDSLQWANQVGKITLEPMNLNADEESWKQWVTNRQGDGNQTAAVYGTKRDFLTKDEQQMIMNHWQSDDTTMDQKIGLIARLSEFGIDADNVFEEILSKGDGKKESHYFAHIAGLMNANPNQAIIGELAADFFSGFALKDNVSIASAELLFGEDKKQMFHDSQKVFTEFLNGSFLSADSNLTSTLFDMTRIIYVDRTSTSTSKKLDKKLFGKIVNELIGGTSIGGVNHGGIAEFNEQATFVPSWMQTDNFEEVITGLTDVEWEIASGGQVPIWYNGSETGEFKLNGDVFNRKDGKDQPYLWVVGDGKYIVSFNTPYDNVDPQYLATKGGDNGYFILDLNLVKDQIKLKYTNIK
jgi:hypothetical protein